MKRHILAILCVLLLALTALVGCDGHVHTYSDAWTVNETHHWHKSTCEEGDECADAKASEATHVDINKDKVCDVCDYDYGHTHTFAETYSNDESGHWYAVTCGCSGVSKNVTAHTDAGNDGVCDVCQYSSCEHTYDRDAWAADEDGHWRASTCGHAVKADADEHDYNDAGICEVCAYHDGEIKTAEAVKIGGYYGDTVNSGYVVYESDYSAGISTTYIQYVFGEKHTAITSVNSSEYGTSVNEFYYEMIDGVVFSIWDEAYIPVDPESEPYSKTQKNSDASSASMKGYDFNVFSRAPGEVSAYYGVEELIASLYAEAQNALDFTEFTMLDGEGTVAYVFAYTAEVYAAEAMGLEYDYTKEQYVEYWYDTYFAYTVTVTFTLGEDNNFEFVNVTAELYEYALDVLPEEAEPVDGEETAPATYSRISLNPVGTDSFTIAQTAGERNAEPKYDSSEILASDFDLVMADGTVVEPGSTIEFTAGVYSHGYYSIVAKTPDGALIYLDSVIATGTFAEYISFDYFDWGPGAQGCAVTFDVPDNAIIYTLTLKTLNSEEKEYYIQVNPVPFTGFTVWYESVDRYETPDNSYEISYTGTDIVVPVWAIPNVEGKTYTATMPTNEFATLVDNGDGTYTITAKAIGEYVITFVADEKDADGNDITATFTLKLTPPPSLESLGLAGNTYKPVPMYGTAPDIELTFGEDNVVIVNNGYNAAGTTPAELLASGTYGIVVEPDGTFVITDSTGAAATFSITGYAGQYTLMLGKGYANMFNLMKQSTSNEGGEGGVDVAAAIAGKEWVSDLMDSYGQAPLYVMDIDYNGYTEINYNGEWYGFSYSVDGNTIIITDCELSISEGAFVYEDGKIICTLPDSTVITFT